MRMDALIKTMLFTIFLAVGLGAIFLSILVDEIINYYDQQARLVMIQQANNALIQMDKNTVELVEAIEDDPDILRRLIPMKFGIEPNEPNAVIPATGQAEFQIAQQIISKIDKTNIEPVQMPAWLYRCNSPMPRTVILLAGCGLILVAFACFTTKRP